MMGGKSASLLNASPKLYGSSFRRLKQTRQTRPALHSAKLRQLPTSLAMGHFDHHYPAYYGPRWNSIRLALLCRYKSVAMVNNFANSQKISDAMERLGCVEMMSVVRSRLEELLIDNPVSVASATGGTTPAAADSPDAAESPAAADAPAIEVQKIEAEAAGRLRVVRGGADELGALLDHVPASQLYGDDHWLEEGDYFKCLQDSGDIEVVFDRENHLSLPEALKVYCFPPGDISRFPHPEMDAFGLTDYYPFDAGSLLSVLLLDVRAGDRVLDMCAAPGGKSLAILQTLRPKLLVCNDVESARLRRLTSVLDQYLPQEADRPTEIRITRQRGETMEERAFYDKVLVDVPCFADRHSLASDDNNIFSIGRSRERILIPELQTNLLRSAMIAVRPGGTVVYSTCTLSPVQNDGVVHMALRRIWEETGIQMVVKDTGVCMRAFYPFMWTARGVGLRYGQQVLPSMANNFGPSYVAKLVRVN